MFVQVHDLRNKGILCGIGSADGNRDGYRLWSGGRVPLDPDHLAAAMATGGTGLGGGDIKFCGILGLIYGPSGMALVFFVAAVFAMPMVLLFRRLSRLRQPIAIPFLPFLACGCSVATLAELFL